MEDEEELETREKTVNDAQPRFQCLDTDLMIQFVIDQTFGFMLLFF